MESSNEQKIWNYLYAKIGNAYGVAGLMGNLYAESAFNPKNLQDSFESKLGYTDETYTNAVDEGTYSNFIKDNAGYGLAQWTYSTRKQNLYNYVKSQSVSIGDLDAQLDFLCKELSEGYSDVWSTLKSATSILQASNIVLTKYEQPADQSESVKTKRANYGQVYYDKYTCSSSSTKTTGGNIMSKNISPNAVITIAKAEEGYLEKASNSNLDSKTANVGSNNYTKYWRDMANLGLGNYQGSYWCACFVHWCFYKAYGLSTSQSLLLQRFFINCQTMYDLATNKKQIYTTPKVGDVVLFWTASSGQYGHTGIVISVGSNGKSFTTIEGNTSGGSTVIANGGGVSQKTYTLSNLTKPRFMRPNYSTTTTSSTSTTTATSTTSTTTTLNETPQWTGTISTEATVRTWAGTSYSECSFSPLKAGTKVQVCDTVKASKGADWYYILYNNKYGFTHSKFVSKDVTSSVQGNAQASSKVPYMVKITTSALNIRSGAGTNYNVVGCITDMGTYTISEEKNGWGKLLSGVGWICLEYTKKL